MSGRNKSRRGAQPSPGRPIGGKRRGWKWRILGVVAATVVVVGVVARLMLRPGAETASGPGSLPGPSGGPDVAQDVNTLVGQPALAFTLSDSDGKSYTITPGQGRPLVLIFHMGIT